MTYVISEPCIDVKDKSCIEECPVDCIYEGDRMLYIHPDECVDCACEPVCPVEAIFYDDDVPAQWKDFTAANAAFFTEGEEPLGLGRGGQRWRCAARRRIRRQLSGLRDQATALACTPVAGSAAVGSAAARPAGACALLAHAWTGERGLAADVGHLDPVGGGAARRSSE